MSLTDSPYQSLQLLIYVKVISYVERKDALNTFQWSHAKLNLPGDESCTPKLPWVTKVRSDGHLASELFIYVDDSRIIAHSELVCWCSEKLHLQSYLEILWSETGYFGLLGNKHSLYIILSYLIDR